MIGVAASFRYACRLEGVEGPSEDAIRAEMAYSREGK